MSAVQGGVSALEEAVPGPAAGGLRRRACLPASCASQVLMHAVRGACRCSKWPGDSFQACCQGARLTTAPCNIVLRARVLLAQHSTAAVHMLLSSLPHTLMHVC